MNSLQHTCSESGTSLGFLIRCMHAYYLHVRSIKVYNYAVWICFTSLLINKMKICRVGLGLYLCSFGQLREHQNPIGQLFTYSSSYETNIIQNKEINAANNNVIATPGRCNLFGAPIMSNPVVSVIKLI